MTEPNYLTVAVNGVGVFKWLCVRGQVVNAEEDQVSATLVQAIPVARGYQLNKMIRTGNEFLIGTADNQVLKYDTAQGYRGYCECQKLT